MQTIARGSGELFIFGVLAGLLAGLVNGLLFPAQLAHPFVIAALLAPAMEELVRTVAFVIHARYGHVGAIGARAPIIFWGIGFGADEFAPRVVDILLSGASAPVAAAYVLGALSPYVMHVLTTLIAARLVLAGRILAAFTTCFAIHVAHNAYVLWIHQLAPIALPEILVRLAVLLSATFAAAAIGGKRVVASSATGAAD